MDESTSFLGMEFYMEIRKCGSMPRRSDKWNKRLSIIEALIYAALAEIGVLRF
jgi:hypothetical protein